MKRETKKTIAPHGAKRPSLESYITGFILSLVLTLAAYFCVVNDIITGKAVIVTIVVLAVTQLLVQLIFFLHLDQETKPRLNLLVFLFMTLVLGIIVVGSLWIMYSLDYNMMPHEAEEYLLEEEGIDR